MTQFKSSKHSFSYIKKKSSQLINELVLPEGFVCLGQLEVGGPLKKMYHATICLLVNKTIQDIKVSVNYIALKWQLRDILM